jgi:hypothetical protein
MRHPALPRILPPTDTTEQMQGPAVVQRDVAPVEIRRPTRRQDGVPGKPILDSLQLGRWTVRVLAACSAAYATIVGDVPPCRDEGQRLSYATTERLKGTQEVSVDEGRTVALGADLIQGKVRRNPSPIFHLVQRGQRERAVLPVHRQWPAQIVGQLEPGYGQTGLRTVQPIDRERVEPHAVEPGLHLLNDGIHFVAYLLYEKSYLYVSSLYVKSSLSANETVA